MPVLGVYKKKNYPIDPIDLFGCACLKNAPKPIKNFITFQNIDIPNTTYHVFNRTRLTTVCNDIEKSSWDSFWGFGSRFLSVFSQKFFLSFMSAHKVSHASKWLEELRKKYETEFQAFERTLETVAECRTDKWLNRKW